MTDEERQEFIRAVRAQISRHLNKFKQMCDTHGLFSPEAEEVYDDFVEIRYDEVTVGDAVYIVDNAVDGYLVKPRVQVSDAKACWAFAYTGGGDVHLVWFSSQCTAWHHGSCLKACSGQDSTYTLYIKPIGIWPVKEGLLPIPPSNKIQYI